MPIAASREVYGPAEHRRTRIYGSARTAGRNWSGGAEGAAAGTKRGLPDSAADVEWRRSPRSSFDPNKGSWRGRSPAGYEVGGGNPRCAELHLGTQGCQHVRERDDDDQHSIEQA